MSCFVAIPSVIDEEKRPFIRVKRWNKVIEFIQILPGGVTAHVRPQNLKRVGLLVVSQEFLKRETAEAAKIMLDAEVEGIFLHPGETNQPGDECLNKFVADLDGNLKPILIKLAAFTYSGDTDFQVHCLRTVWTWLKGDNDGKTEIPNLDLGSLSDEFKRLQWLGGTAVRINTLLLQCWKIQALYSTEPPNTQTRTKWLSELTTWLGGNDHATLQILADHEMGKATAAFRKHLTSLVAPPPVDDKSIPPVCTDFIEAARRYIKSNRPHTI